MRTRSLIGRKRKNVSKRKFDSMVESHGRKKPKTDGEEPEKANGQDSDLNIRSILQVDNGDQKSFLLFLSKEQVVVILGKAKLKCLKGTVNCSGFNIKPSTLPLEIYSPSSQSLLTVRECSRDMDQDDRSLSHVKKIISSLSRKIQKMVTARANKASSVVVFDKLVSNEMKFVCQHKEFQDAFDKSEQLSIYKEMQDCAKIVNDFKEEIMKKRTADDQSPVLLICGGKGVGKSSLARSIINNLLLSCSEVCYLECDVGQTECTPPGVLSLNCVNIPQLAYFFGDVSPKENPNLYINCISSLYKDYSKMYSSKPLIVNTHGWVKGFGVSLLLDIIRITKPTHIVQINSIQDNKNLPTITREFLDFSPGWLQPGRDASQMDDVSGLYPIIYQTDSACLEDNDSSGSSLRPSDHRHIRLMAYFSTILSSLQVNSLLSCKPYKVSWSSVAIHINHTMVFNEQCSESDLPGFLQETPIADCVGLGIVRNIDPVNKFFYIVTPVSLEQLQKVNVLLKGNLEIPAPMLLKIGSPGAPYLSSEFSYEIKGAGTRKVRYNLQRKKFNSSPARQ